MYFRSTEGTGRKKQELIRSLRRLRSLFLSQIEVVPNALKVIVPALSGTTLVLTKGE